MVRRHMEVIRPPADLGVDADLDARGHAERRSA
jgi:hypothetical protein